MQTDERQLFTWTLTKIEKASTVCSDVATRRSAHRITMVCSPLFSTPISHHQTYEVTNSTTALMQHVAGACAFDLIGGSKAGVSRLQTQEHTDRDSSRMGSTTTLANGACAVDDEIHSKSAAFACLWQFLLCCATHATFDAEQVCHRVRKAGGVTYKACIVGAPL